MRVYALLFGIVLTGAYGYAAHVAVSSVAAGRDSDAAATAPTAGEGSDRIWYGGVIDPIIVESKGGVTSATVAKRRLLDAPTERCLPVSRPTYHAVS